MFDYKQRPPTKKLDENWDKIKWNKKENKNDSNRPVRRRRDTGNHNSR